MGVSFRQAGPASCLGILPDLPWGCKACLHSVGRVGRWPLLSRGRARARVESWSSRQGIQHPVSRVPAYGNAGARFRVVVSLSAPLSVHNVLLCFDVALHIFMPPPFHATPLAPADDVSWTDADGDDPFFSSNDWPWPYLLRTVHWRGPIADQGPRRDGGDKCPALEDVHVEGLQSSTDMTVRRPESRDVAICHAAGPRGPDWAGTETPTSYD